jgi:lysophospholipase L1-like esterase
VSLQAASVTIEAESGVRGADFTSATQNGVQYISISTDPVNTDFPGNANRVATYTVPFPEAGTYNLYARIRVGPDAPNDDSMFYANGFDAKSPTNADDWIRINNLCLPSGFTNQTDTVVENGDAGNQVWKWLNLSQFTDSAGESPVTFPVAAGNLVQTFQIGAREDGFDMDKFVFGTSSYTFTVADLDVGGSGTPPDPPVPVKARVFIVGDSTVMSYASTDTKRGWGQEIYHYFKNNVSFADNALSGRSSKTFITEGWWAQTVAQLSTNDYVLIQFGHNDSHDPSLPESTDATGEYRTYLQQYIDDSKAIGAIPVMVTPMHRRSFDTNGNLLSYYVSNGTNVGDLAPYAASMKQVAQSNNVACVDLFASSGVVMQLIGNNACIPMFVAGDITHFNETGAIVMASLVAQGLSEVLPPPAVPANDRELTQYLRTDVLRQHHADLAAGKFPSPVFTGTRESENLRLDWFIQPSDCLLQQSMNLTAWTNYSSGAAGSLIVVPQSSRAFFRLVPP